MRTEITAMAAPAAGAAAFLMVLLLVPVILRLCRRWKLFDSPGPLKIHAQPVPRLGGVAIALALFVAPLFCGRVAVESGWLYFAGLGLVWVAGLVDDVRGLSPALRLASQIAAGALVWRGGWRLPLLGEGALDLAATCLFVAVFANAFNFLDGSDGLASGVAGIIAAAYITLPGAARSPIGYAVACGLVGACAAFLVFNFPRASIFMGDSGSTALGFSIAFLGLNLYRSNSAVSSSLLFPVWVAALPLLDVLLAGVRRLQGGASIFYGDRRHSYDLPLARGWSARQVALACYGITAGLAAVGWMAARTGLARFYLFSAPILGALVLAAIRLGSLVPREGRARIEQVRT
ncbi:MAG: glycosyltransferase family 4 protein [Candidatus Acidiferrales bacterium]